MMMEVLKCEGWPKSRLGVTFEANRKDSVVDYSGTSQRTRNGCAVGLSVICLVRNLASIYLCDETKMKEIDCKHFNNRAAPVSSTTG